VDHLVAEATYVAQHAIAPVKRRRPAERPKMPPPPPPGGAG